MNAIIETGGKQFRVAPGDVLRVPKLDAEAGRKSLSARSWLCSRIPALVSGDAAASARVNATVSAHDKTDKILVFKFKRKKQYKRTRATGRILRRFGSRDIVA